MFNHGSIHRNKLGVLSPNEQGLDTLEWQNASRRPGEGGLEMRDA